MADANKGKQAAGAVLTLLANILGNSGLLGKLDGYKTYTAAAVAVLTPLAVAGLASAGISVPPSAVAILLGAALAGGLYGLRQALAKIEQKVIAPAPSVPTSGDNTSELIRKATGA